MAFLYISKITYLFTHIDVVRADVDLPRVPVGGLVDGHPRLAPLQLVVQPDGQDLRWEYLGVHLAKISPDM